MRLNEIINGRRGVTPSTALRLAKALSTTPEFWLNSQLALDLYRASHDEEEIRELERIEPVRSWYDGRDIAAAVQWVVEVPIEAEFRAVAGHGESIEGAAALRERAAASPGEDRNRSRSP